MKGICFIEPLYHHVVSGCKVQTRRISKHQHFSYSELSNINQGVYINPAVPKYLVGETVYLKEPYSYLSLNNQELVLIYKYGEDYSDVEELSPIKWSNKLFMPESAARYFIKITGVRAERLQDISNVDCRKEGVNICKGCIEKGCSMGEVCAYPSAEYRELIKKINGKDIWERNPWVWVYDFQLIK